MGVFSFPFFAAVRLARSLADSGCAIFTTPSFYSHIHTKPFGVYKYFASPCSVCIWVKTYAGSIYSVTSLFSELLAISLLELESQNLSFMFCSKKLMQMFLRNSIYSKRIPPSLESWVDDFRTCNYASVIWF